MIARRNVYEIRFAGPGMVDGRLSARVLSGFLQQFMDVVQRSLRLALEGESVKAGTRPGWLARACDLDISRIDLRSGVLEVELPELGSLVDQMLGQIDFWKERPANEDDVIKVFLRSLNETTIERLDGNFYDVRILEGLARLGRFLKNLELIIEIADLGTRDDELKEGQQLELVEHAVAPVRIDGQLLNQVSRLQALIPEARRMLISGRLDMIRHKSGRFQLAVTGGQGIPGKLGKDHSSAEALRDYWGAAVTVRGMVQFKASGEARFIEADRIQRQGRGQSHLERIPRADD